MTAKLLAAGFISYGEELLTEAMFYDTNLAWQQEGKTCTRYVRVRTNSKWTLVTFKDQRQDIPTTEAIEVEYNVASFENTSILL